MSRDNTAESILDDIDEVAEDSDALTVDDVVSSLGARGFGALFVLLAVIEMSPIGGIPGVPTILAALIGLIAVQILIGRSHIWIPDIIGARALPAETLRKGVDGMEPWARKIDGLLGHHLEALTRDTGRKVGAVAAVVLCFTVPFLEIIPFGSTVPMAAIALIGLALTAHDGVMMLVALGFAAVALITGLYLLI